FDPGPSLIAEIQRVQSGAPANDKANYVSFLRELNMALPSGALLSIASAASAFYLDPGFDLAGIANALPFYGKYWNNVEAPLNGDDLWRQLGTYGTELAWRDLGNSFDLTKLLS
uniref:ABC transporter substrate-binding protein n=1 Tax=Globodera pallida TaxID=36090 RepID=A0A183CR15_GLOPA